MLGGRFAGPAGKGAIGLCVQGLDRTAEIVECARGDSPDAVSDVDNDRQFAVERDRIGELRPVAVGCVAGGVRAKLVPRGEVRLSSFDAACGLFAQVGIERLSTLLPEFDAVVRRRVVRGRDRDARVRPLPRDSAGDCRRRRESDIDHVGAGLTQARSQRVHQRGTALPCIPPDDDPVAVDAECAPHPECEFRCDRLADWPAYSACPEHISGRTAVVFDLSVGAAMSL